MLEMDMNYLMYNSAGITFFQPFIFSGRKAYPFYSKLGTGSLVVFFVCYLCCVRARFPSTNL